jgi:dTDP-4-dehydrorhamnose 3,5-epimerase
MEIASTALDGVLVLIPRRFRDERGHFAETWTRRRLQEAGVDLDFVQDNESLSHRAGTLRGLHYQAPPHAQAKLVRCLVGAIWDVAVDVRRGSPTFGRWVGEELSAENGRQLLIPEGFLHGFSTLTPEALVAYKCTDYYAPAADGGVRWDSPALAIDWRLDGRAPLLSPKDAGAPDFADWQSPFDAGATP